MRDRVGRHIYEQFKWPTVLLLGVHVVGTVGYRWLTHGLYSWIDCLYMTFITVG